MPNPRTFKWIRASAALAVLVLLVSSFAACNRSNATTTATTASAKADTGHGTHATEAAPTEVAQKIPHYFDDPEAAKPFPKTLDPETMKSPAAKQAYATARRIPEVLAQQPCYCFCDKGFGHGSLLHCHIDNHSAD